MKLTDLKTEYDKWLERSTGWMQDDLLSLKTLSGEDFENALIERFSEEAEFGTGGLRSVMRAGKNGINDFWIVRITQGLSNFVSSTVIAYDTRLNSKHFAEIAANNLSRNGVDVYLFKIPVPTPMLSYSVMKLGCDAGIVITASHNPPEYNGFKVYDENGVQYVPKKVDRLKGFFVQCDLLPEDDDYKRGDPERIHMIGSEIVDDYFNAVHDELDPLDDLERGNEAIRVLYTPLHGTGAEFVPGVLRHYGLKTLVVEEQMVHDPEFKTSPEPNPEAREAYQMALEKAENEKPELIIATDPDADRLGVLALYNGTYKRINGNELGILLLDYILRKTTITGKSSDNAVLKTIVTTDMIISMSQRYNFKVYQTLTGFKYLGEKNIQLKKEGINTLFSFEESYGYLYGEHARDKDAVSTAGLLALLIQEQRSGKNLLRRIDQLRKEFGYYREKLLTYKCHGSDGKRKMEEFLKYLRKTKPKEIWGDEVSFRDYRNERGELKDNVIEFLFKEGEKVTFRPSGTEPKVKAYLSAFSNIPEVSSSRLEDLEEKVNGLFHKKLGD